MLITLADGTVPVIVIIIIIIIIIIQYLYSALKSCEGCRGAGCQTLLTHYQALKPSFVYILTVYNRKNQDFSY